MANAFSFKEVNTKTMKVVGELDVDIMSIMVDGEPKKLNTLLSAFDMTDVELVVKVKTESELEEPISDEAE